jgi:hypothetical protein
MPVHSARQYRLFQAILHGKPRKGGPSKAVAAEMIHKTPKKKRSMFARKGKT